MQARHMRFSSKYRRHVRSRFNEGTAVTTTRLFDDKHWQVGESVIIDVDEKPFTTAVITDIDRTTFQQFLSDVSDPAGTTRMYEDYYQRPIQSGEEVKQIALRID